MNKDKIVELFKSGAYFNSSEDKIYHPSFRKGYRTMRNSNISFIAAQRVLMMKLVYDPSTMIYKFSA